MKKGSLTNYRHSAYCMHPFRKEELFTDSIIQECVTCSVVHARENDGGCLIVCRLVRRERICARASWNQMLAQ